MRQSASAREGARQAAHLRRLNLDRVLGAAIAAEGPLTRGQLIDATGLSAPTVGSLASYLIRRGLLTDLGAGPSRGGRRPGRMEFNARHGFVAAIALGSSRTQLALADLRGELLTRRLVVTPQEKSPEGLLVSLAQELGALMCDAGISSSRLLAVAASAPGAVDPSRGMVVALASNLKGWSEVPIGPILRKALPAPVVVENDVNLAVLGEHWKGAARGHDTCVFLWCGTGIGAGIMVNQQLHHGHHFLAGEIGLMCMGPQFVETDFGSRGCLETLTGMATLEARWGAGAEGATDWLVDLFKAAEAGDPAARKTVDEMGTYIGMAAANVCSVIDPSVIVLGGPLVGNMSPLEADVRRILERIIPLPPMVVVSSLENDAPLWGSLLLACAEAREQLRQTLGRGED